MFTCLVIKACPSTIKAYQPDWKRETRNWISENGCTITINISITTRTKIFIYVKRVMTIYWNAAGFRVLLRLNAFCKRRIALYVFNAGPIFKPRVVNTSALSISKRAAPSISLKGHVAIEQVTRLGRKWRGMRSLQHESGCRAYLTLECGSTVRIAKFFEKSSHLVSRPCLYRGHQHRVLYRSRRRGRRAKNGPMVMMYDFGHKQFSYLRKNASCAPSDCELSNLLPTDRAGKPKNFRFRFSCRARIGFCV